MAFHSFLLSRARSIWSELSNCAIHSGSGDYKYFHRGNVNGDDGNVTVGAIDVLLQSKW